MPADGIIAGPEAQVVFVAVALDLEVIDLAVVLGGRPYHGAAMVEDEGVRRRLLAARGDEDVGAIVALREGLVDVEDGRGHVRRVERLRDIVAELALVVFGVAEEAFVVGAHRGREEERREGQEDEEEGAIRGD